jgi:hypothetical protein
MKHIPEDSLILLNRRRLLGRLVLGGTAGLALAACGGGGGGDDSDEINIRAAYDRVVEGMTRAQVVRAVGREPNSVSSGETLRWSENGQQLGVDIHDTTGTTAWVRWDRLTAPIATLQKMFY